MADERLDLLHEVAAAYNGILRLRADWEEERNAPLLATVEHTGGGIFCVKAPCLNGAAAFLYVGCECGWGADYYGVSEEFERSINFEVSDDWVEPVRIACLIYETHCAIHHGTLE